jgi:hypothetical protein
MNRTELLQLATNVNQGIKNALTGPAPMDAVDTIVKMGAAVLTKGTDVQADIAAIAAFTKFNSDLLTAFTAAPAE